MRTRSTPTGHTRRGHRRHVLALLVGVLLAALPASTILGGAASAQDTGSSAPATAAEPVTVAIKPAPPFVLDTDSPQGFSIDLWEEVAQRAGLRTEYLRVGTVQEQLDAVRSGRADVGVAAISITSEREQTLDFSTPIFNSGLQLMTRTQSGVSLGNMLSTLFSGSVGSILVFMAALSLVVGVVAWVIERKDNPEFHRDARHGIFDGLWWAIVTMMTVGYGDRVPRRRLGRILTILWMVTGVILVANFTAVITANLTVSKIRGDVSSVSQLESGNVATVSGTTSESFLTASGVTPVLRPNIEEAAAALERGEVDAVVYDSPILRYHVQTRGADRLTTVGTIFDEEYYGIALPVDSELKEAVDRALLETVEDGTYAAIEQRWFGDSD